MSTITLDALENASSTDIYNSEEFVAFKRRDDPAWVRDEHAADCNGCAGDAIDREAFRTFLADTTTPELLAEQLAALEEEAYLEAAARTERAARYSVVQGTYRYDEDSDGDSWAIRKGPGLSGELFAVFGTAPNSEDRARRELKRLIDGSITETYLGWVNADDFTLPDLEEDFAMDDPRLIPLWSKVYEHVKAAGNVSYYNTLANADLVPSRHVVRKPKEVDPHDPRLVKVLTALAEASLDERMCQVYDQMCEELGFPTRADLGVPLEKDYYVNGYVEVTVRVPASVTVTASDGDEAVRIADNEYGVSGYISDLAYAVREAVESGNYEFGDGEWEDAEESD